MYLPPEVIATWPMPNYINPVTRGPALVIMHLVLYPLALGVVTLRTFTRLRISMSFGLNDVSILLAMLPTTAFMIVSLVADFHYGGDRHAWDVEPHRATVGLKLSLAGQILYAAASALTRLSMLLLCREMLLARNEPPRWIIAFAIAAIPLGFVVFAIVVIFQCSPISAWWTISYKPQRCINEKIHLLAQGILNIVADFLVVLTPIKIALGLDLPFRQRIIVSMLFGAGFIVCLAGIARTVFMYRATNGYHDATWDGFPCWVASAVELYIGILCTSIPPTKPFFARYIPMLLSPTTNHDGNNRDRTLTISASGYALEFTNSVASFNTQGYSIQNLYLPNTADKAGNSKIWNNPKSSIEMSQVSSNTTGVDHLIA